MLGLGNRLNKSRVYKTFVGQGISYEYIAGGSHGEGGYVIYHYLLDANGSLTTNLSLAQQIKYVEVAPVISFIDGSSQGTFLELSQAIHKYDANDTDYLQIPSWDDESIFYSDWRPAYEGNEWEGFLDNVFFNPNIDTNYYATEDGLQYITVNKAQWLSWSGGSPAYTQGDPEVTLYSTDSSEYETTRLSEVSENAYYTIAVREFTTVFVPIDGATAPGSDPSPLLPEPEADYQRTSGNLTSETTDNVENNAINLQVNSALLGDSDIPMYASKPKTPNILSDRLSLRFLVEFPVDSNNNVLGAEGMWSPLNTEQKKIKINLATLGYEDFPFYDHSTQIGTQAMYDAFFADSDGFLNYVNHKYYSGIEINLNKVSSADLDNNSISLVDLESDPSLVGFWQNVTTNEKKFGYIGYLDLSSFPAKFLLPNSNVFDDYTLADVCSDPGLLDNDLGEEWHRMFLVRITSVQYLTDERTPTFASNGLFPTNMKYIFMPLLLNTQAGAFYTLSSTGPGTFNGFSATVWTAQGQNLPPLIEGSNEDYYS